MSTQNPNPGSQGTIQSTFTFPEFSNLVEKTFVELLQNLPLDADPLFITKSIGHGEGDVKQMNEQDFETYAKGMPEGANAQKGKTGIGFHKQINWYRYGLEFDITHKQRTTEKWGDVVANTMEALTQAVPLRMNLDKTHIITFGNATSYVNMDGFVRDVTTGAGTELFTATAPLAHSPFTYSNIVPGAPAFSKTALELAQQLTVSNILDNFGVKKRMAFDTIWTSDDPETVNNVKQLLRSISDPEQDNSGVMNPYESRMSHLVLSQLATTPEGSYDSSKAKWWGIGAFKGMGANRWQAYDLIWESPYIKGSTPMAGHTATNQEDYHNDNWSYGARGASNQGVLSSRGIIVSLVAN